MNAENTINVNVPLNVDGIDAAFAKMVLESKLGGAIEKAIDEVFDSNASWRTTTIEQAVKSAVQHQIGIITKKAVEMQTDRIRDIVASYLTDDMIHRLTVQVVDRWVKGLS